MQAELNPAGFVAPEQNAFGHQKRAGLKLIMIAKGGVDVFSKITEAPNLVKASQHYGLISPVSVRSMVK
jgi:hypothetical protein